MGPEPESHQPLFDHQPNKITQGIGILEGLQSGSVETSTRGFYWGEQDAAYPGVTSVSGLVIGRRYYSRLTFDGTYSTGVRWVSSLSERVIPQTTDDGKRALQYFHWTQPFNDPDFWFVEQEPGSNIFTSAAIVGGTITAQTVPPEEPLSPIFGGGNSSSNSNVPPAPQVLGYTLTTKDGRVHLFDSSGWIVERRDNFGNATHFSYQNPPGGPIPGSQTTITITDSRGAVYVVVLDQLGYILTITDPLGYVITYNYLTVGTTKYLVDVTYPARSVYEPNDTVVTRAPHRSYHYDANGRLDEVRDDYGNVVVHNTYDPFEIAQVASQSDGLGHTWTFTHINLYDLDVLTPKGFKRRYVHNSGGQVTEIRQYVANFLGGAARSTDQNLYYAWLFDRVTATCNCGPIRKITEPDGGVIEVVYDASFDLREVHKRSPDLSQELVWKWTYDAQHYTQSFIPPEGNAAADPTPYTVSINRQTTYGILTATTTIPPRSWRTSPSVWVQTYDSRGRMTDSQGPPNDTGGNSFGGHWNYYAGTGASAFLPFQYCRRDAVTIAATYQWDANGRVTGITAQSGQQFTCTYDPEGAPFSWLAPTINGQQYSHDWIYDGNGRLRRLRWKYYANASDTTGAWIEWKYSYDAAGQLVQLSKALDAAGTTAVSTWQYDSNGNVTQAVDPDARTTTVVYDERDLPWSLTDAVGTTEAVSKTYTYNADGELATIIESLDATQQVRFDNEYDVFDRLVRYRIRNAGNLTQEAGYCETSYDSGTRPSELRVFGWNGTAFVMVRKYAFAYNDFHDNPTQQVTYLYGADDGGLQRAVTTDILYGASGLPILEMTGGIVIATYTYETWGLPKQVMDLHGNRLETTWNDYGHALTETNAYWDPVASSTLVTTKTFARDLFGRATTITESGSGVPNSVHTYTYDSIDNVASYTRPDGTVWTYQYRYDGNIVREDEVIQGSTTRATQYTYTNGGLLASVIDDRNHAVNYIYDGRARLKQEVYPDASLWTYSYNLGDMLTALVTPTGRRVDFSYDWRGMLAGATYKNGAGTVMRTDAVIVDPAGFIKRVTKTEGSVTSYVEMPHDGLGNVLSETVSGAGQPTSAVTFTRDSLGRVTAITGPSGVQHVYTYDDRHRVRTVSHVETGVNRLVATYDYLGAMGAVRRRVTGDGNTLDVTRDGMGQVTRMLTSGAASVADFNYGYDLNHQVTYENRAFDGKGDVFWYDGLGRLKQTTKDSVNPVAELVSPQSTTRAYFRQFFLDGDDHRTQVVTMPQTGSATTVNYTTHLTRHEYTSIQEVGQAAVSRTFDTDGRLLTNGSRTFSYDIVDNLTQVQDGSSVTATYTYDALGRRWTKTVGNVQTRFVYSGPWVIEEYQKVGSGSEQQQAVHFHGPGVDDIVSSKIRDIGDVNGNSNTSEFVNLYYHTNRMASVSEVTMDTGAIVERYRYEDYGKPTILSPGGTPRSTSAIGNTHLFTGREYDAETGLYYYRAREYDPSTGSFLQEDPLGMMAGINVVAYVNCNPVNMGDPFGTEGIGALIDGIMSFINENRGAIAGLILDLMGPLEGILDLLSAATGKDITGWLRGGMQGEPASMGWWDRACAAASAAVTIAVGAIKLIPKLKGILEKIKAAVDKAKEKMAQMGKGALCKLTGACFVAGTVVALSDGSFVPIEEVDAGMSVRCEEPAAMAGLAGKEGIEAVGQLARLSYDGALITLLLEDSRGNRAEVSGTPEHPFWSVTRHTWIPLAQVALEETLDGIDGGVNVVERKVGFGKTEVFSLSIGGPHDYRVSKFGVLVHNNCGTDIGGSGKPKFHYKTYDSMHAAEDAAREASHGHPPVFHGNPKNGPPHWHATDGDGNPISNPHYTSRAAYNDARE